MGIFLKRLARHFYGTGQMGYYSIPGMRRKAEENGKIYILDTEMHLREEPFLQVILRDMSIL